MAINALLHWSGPPQNGPARRPGGPEPGSYHNHHHTFSTFTTMNSITPAFTIGSSASFTPNHDVRTSHVQSSSHPVFISHPVNVVGGPLYGQEEPTIPPASKAAFNPAALTAEDIQAFVQKAINGEESRKYKINSSPTNRPVRVYADGRLRYLFLPTPLCSLRQHNRRV